MAKASSQKFIARNRAPRVQIEYDVELYGAEKKIQLPFVMGVLADLSGKPAEPLPPVADRKFLEIDVDNFDNRMKAHEAARGVPGAEHADRRRQHATSRSRSRAWTTSRRRRWRARSSRCSKLLEARQQLANLITYMDGKSGAEELRQPSCCRIPRCCRRWPTHQEPAGRTGVVNRVNRRAENSHG